MKRKAKEIQNKNQRYYHCSQLKIIAKSDPAKYRVYSITDANRVYNSLIFMNLCRYDSQAQIEIMSQFFRAHT